MFKEESHAESIESSFTEEETRSDGIRVVTRVRPLFDAEKRGAGGGRAVEVHNDNQTVALSTSVDDSRPKTFTFHGAFGESCTQQQFFERSGVKQLVNRALEGYSCTVFAFGQTGSGKTHTMTGPDDGLGMIQLALSYLWGCVGAQNQATFTFQASYIEIYNEQVLDLLNPRSNRGPLPVRWNSESGFHVEHLLMEQCDDEEEMLEVLHEGLRVRSTAEHQMNERSSRSHSILTIHIKSVANTISDEFGEGQASIRYGSISFVDLAGSERVSRTKTTGQTLVESNNINKSLMILGKCISALADPRKRKGHIPYRESCLTMLLKDSLGGSGMTMMIACVSPAAASLQETHNTLRYASRAKRIQNRPIVRMDPQQQLIAALRREIRMLKTEMSYLRRQANLAEGPLSDAWQRLGTAAAQDGAHRVSQPSHHEEDMAAMAAMADEMTQMKILLQQYMQENEDLRRENVMLYSQQQAIHHQQELVQRENEHLSRQIKTIRHHGPTISGYSSPSKLQMQQNQAPTSLRSKRQSHTGPPIVKVNQRRSPVKAAARQLPGAPSSSPSAAPGSGGHRLTFPDLPTSRQSSSHSERSSASLQARYKPAAAALGRNTSLRAPVPGKAFSSPTSPRALASPKPSDRSKGQVAPSKHSLSNSYRPKPRQRIKPSFGYRREAKKGYASVRQQGNAAKKAAVGTDVPPESKPDSPTKQSLSTSHSDAAQTKLARYSGIGMELEDIEAEIAAVQRQLTGLM